MRTPIRRRAWLCIAALLAGPAMADDAWVATYRHRQDQRECELVLVRSKRRVEYRGCGLPTRLWRRLGDGVELLELHPESGNAVRYAPGDLRALDREPDWARLSGLAPPELRVALAPGKPIQAQSRAAIRYRGQADDGRRIELDWLPDAQLPARYRIETEIRGDGRRASRRDVESYELTRLTQVDEATAFSSTASLQDIDGADLGD